MSNSPDNAMRKHDTESDDTISEVAGTGAGLVPSQGLANPPTTCEQASSASPTETDALGPRVSSSPMPDPARPDLMTPVGLNSVRSAVQLAVTNTESGGGQGPPSACSQRSPEPKYTSYTRLSSVPQPGAQREGVPPTTYVPPTNIPSSEVREHPTSG